MSKRDLILLRARQSYRMCTCVVSTVVASAATISKSTTVVSTHTQNHKTWIWPLTRSNKRASKHTLTQRVSQHPSQWKAVCLLLLLLLFIHKISPHRMRVRNVWDLKNRLIFSQRWPFSISNVFHRSFEIIIAGQSINTHEWKRSNRSSMNKSRKINDRPCATDGSWQQWAKNRQMGFSSATLYNSLVKRTSEHITLTDALHCQSRNDSFDKRSLWFFLMKPEMSFACEIHGSVSNIYLVFVVQCIRLVHRNYSICSDTDDDADIGAHMYRFLVDGSIFMNGNRKICTRLRITLLRSALSLPHTHVIGEWRRSSQLNKLFLLPYIGHCVRLGFFLSVWPGHISALELNMSIWIMYCVVVENVLGRQLVTVSTSSSHILHNISCTRCTACAPGKQAHTPKRQMKEENR